MTKNKSYQEEAMSFKWVTCNNLSYAVFGMYEEMGELLEKTPIKYYGIRGFFARIIIWLLVLIGKMLGKWAKSIRGKMVDGEIATKHNPPFHIFGVSYHKRISLMNECGDIHWQLANFEDLIEASPEECEEMNIDKLSRRKKNNEIASHKDH